MHYKIVNYNLLLKKKEGSHFDLAFLSVLHHCWFSCATGDAKIKHLHELDGAKERLQIFQANLLEEGSFDSAVEGCEGVFHTASPVTFSANDPQVLSQILEYFNTNMYTLATSNFFSLIFRQN